MSVIVILRSEGDPAKIEQAAKANPERMQKILDHAREHGVIHHRFLGGDGEVIVLDEWESEEGFQAFFGHDKDIPVLMQEAGIATRPEISFYHPLDTRDEI